MFSEGAFGGRETHIEYIISISFYIITIITIFLFFESVHVHFLTLLLFHHLFVCRGCDCNVSLFLQGEHLKGILSAFFINFFTKSFVL